ncbi:bacteriohemerythrin [Colwellia sp. RSH04]|uniref:bacteriohemerythrin n=1 Tax=Colwellia sp. RSH04 TaxID=2305464 RepID=UPI000E598BC3|nr:bacteriohemerythrin [Colwellia sp. RSH04]RHW75699.1 hypothetical protein D1094_11245 [Colwellia sp. RSH04]
MNSLFIPAIKISNYLSFKAKFLVVSLLCIIPLIFFYAVLSQTQWQQIDQAENTLKASEYIIPLRKLVEHVAQTRGMTNVFLHGDASVKQAMNKKIEEKRNTVENDFALLLKKDTELGDELNTNHFPKELHNRWGILKTEAFSGEASKIFSRYTLLITDIIDFMDTVGRQGKMLQASDPTNSYLINSLLHTLPNQIESLGKLRGKGSGILASNSLTTDNKLQIAALSNTRNALNLKKDIEYLFQASPELSNELNQKYQDASNKLNAYLLLAKNEIVDANTVNIKPTAFFEKGSETISSLLILFDAMQPVLEQRMNAQISAAKINVNFYLSIIVVVTLLLIYAYIGIYLAIKYNLNEMIKTSHSICDGELDVRLELKTKDELKVIAESINEITDGLSRSIIAVRESSFSIASAAEEIAQASKNTAVGMDAQSQELAVTSAAVTEMSASVQEVAKNTELGSLSSKQASEEAKNGGQVIQTTIEAINKLAENINTSVEGVVALKENSNDITTILDVIRGIADQTNLLALNAAIEAARAGEQGRGFAVVADEVRTLAHRTQDSTFEIQSMIELIQSGITSVSTNMVESQKFANQSVAQVEQAGAALNTIESSVSEINDMSLQIATAAEQQSCVSEEIAQSIVTISDVANESAQGSKTLAMAGSRLSAMSKEMRLVIQRYNIDETLFNKNEEKIRLLHWENKFSIGIDEADRQHQKMVEMMNNVHIMSTKKRSPAAVANALDALVEYTKVHFQWEEELMDSHGYPQSEEHKKHHQELLNDLVKHKEMVKQNINRDISADISYLNDWVIQHITKGDSHYAKFIQQMS